MKTMKFPFPTEDDLALAAAVIRRGGLVAFPTETVYGLGGSALDPEAAMKIYAAKGRPSNNPLIIHLAKAEDAEKYCVTNGTFYTLASHFCPGPLTMILKKKDCIPYQVTGGLETVAVRIPSDPTAHRLIELAGVPIAAPSANLSGKPSPTCFAHIEHDLDGRADVLLGGGECEIGLESTIVKIDGGTPALLRPGGITPEMLSSVIGDLYIDECVTQKPAEGTRPLAPGMMYRHYAPDAPLVILDGEDEKVYSFLDSKREEHPGVLCFEEDMEALSGFDKRSIGKRGDPLSQARRLFAALRDFNDTSVPVIYARMPDREGVGLAVFNRLIKAAGYTIIKL